MANRAQQRREARKSGGSDMTRFYWILGVVAVIGVGAVGYQVASHKMVAAAIAPVDLKGLEDPTALMKAAQAVIKGDPNAPVTILEFGDYECPACGTFALTVQPQVEARYVTSGKVKFVFYDFPLMSIHPTSFIAARAGRCAGDQDRFWQYHDELYRKQNSWVLQANPIKTFIGFAKDLGMDADAFDACLNSDKYADVVTANLRLAQQLGLNSTPTIMVGLAKGMPRRLGDDFSYKAIAALVDQVLAEAAAPDSASSGGS